MIVDCDPGIDDALALLALAELVRRGRARVDCVTAVAGNAPVERTARNAAFLVRRSALRGTPVRAGGGEAGARQRHGADGLAGVAGEAAAERWSSGGVLEHSRRLGHGGERILALGPLTNLAAALDAVGDPAPGTRVLAMGGSLAGPPEFNFAHDGRAAARVLGSGLAVTVVPIDVTRQVRFAAAAVAAIAREAANPLVGPLLAASLERGGGHAHVHDAVALIALVHPELVRTVPGRLAAAGGRPRLVRDPAGAVEVVTGLDAGAAARHLTTLWIASPP